MTIRDYFKSISLQDIEEFVVNGTTEDLHLEFKTANFPNKADNFDNKNFSKALSGFANSLGGILIWGIKASQNKNGVDVAKELKPINDLLKFENHLKRIEGRSVTPLIEGIEYRRLIKDSDEGYLIVYIPQSDRAPHMAQLSEKHYYKRSGDSFYICEHFDIVDMLNRRVTPRLVTELRNEDVIYVENKDEIKFIYTGIFCISNIGQVSAKNIVLSLKVSPPFKISDFGIDGNGQRGMKVFPSMDTYRKYSSGTELVIHPESIHEVDKISLNEIGLDNKITDLIIDYKIVAEDMKMMKGRILRTIDEITKLARN